MNRHIMMFRMCGILASGTLTTYLWCIPAVAVGTWLGLQLFHRVDDKRFRQIVLVFLLFSGITLVA